MVKLHMSEQFRSRLSRMNNPIATHLLGLTQMDPNRKDYINYIGVSNDDPTKISYLDRNKENKNKIVQKIAHEYYPQCTKCRINKRFFKHIFHRGRWKKNPHFVYSGLPDEIIGYEKRNWYKRTFYFENYMYTFPTPGQEWTGKTWLERLNETPNGLEDYTVGYITVPGQNFIDNKYRLLNGKHTVLSTMGVMNHPIDFIKTVAYEEWDNLWNPDHRLHSSAGKIAKRIIGADFNELFSDKDLESFCEAFRKQGLKETGVNGKFVYEELSGEDILEGYHEDNYYEVSGELGSSCMRYDKCQEYLLFYAENARHVSLGTLYVENKVAARSLLWYPNTKKDPTVKYYDRVFGIDSEATESLATILTGKEFVDIYGNSNKVSFNLDKGYGDFDSYPYLDTFRYIAGTRVSNKEEGHDHVLDCYQGHIHERRTCPCCESDLSNGEGCYIDVRGSSYRNEELCGDCAVYSSHYNSFICEEDSVHIHSIDDHVLRSDAVECYDGCWELDEYATCLHDGKYVDRTESLSEDVFGAYYLRSDIEDYCIFYAGTYYPHDHSDVVQVDGEYYHEHDDSIVYVDSEGEYYLTDDPSLCNINGETYHEDNPDVIYLDSKDEHFLKSDSVIHCIDGIYYHEDELEALEPTEA